MKAVEPEPQPPEVLVEDEPRYLRRQKPLEIKRRKFGKQAWKLYAKVFLGVAATAAGGWLLYQSALFLLFSPRLVLGNVEEIELVGNRYVPRTEALEKFIPDEGRSVLRIPLDERRAALEQIPWVERASVQRVLPNHIRVELTERQPVAFLRLSTELALIDAQGVVLEQPVQGEFRFPVVTGMNEAMPREDREKRIRQYMQFMKEMEQARPGAAEQVSEVDVADLTDVRATLAGLSELGDPATDGQASVLVHFGSGDFLGKFQVFLENIGQWRAAAGRVESVDLRFDRQVVINPESQASTAQSSVVTNGRSKGQRP